MCAIRSKPEEVSVSVAPPTNGWSADRTLYWSAEETLGGTPDFSVLAAQTFHKGLFPVELGTNHV